LHQADGDDRRAQTAHNNIKSFLSTAMRIALGSGLVKVNPVSFPLKGKDPKTHAYTLEQFMRSRWVAAFTGMSAEEIKGLRWEDYKGGGLEVRRTVVHGVVDEPKTAASKASLPVIGVVKQTLAMLLSRTAAMVTSFTLRLIPRPWQYSRTYYDAVCSRIQKRQVLSGTACTPSAVNWQPCCTQSTVSASAL
jgi:integrase